MHSINTTRMKNNLLLISLCLLCIPGLTLHSTETVLLNDTFGAENLSGGDDDGRQLYSLQDLPHSAEWLSSYRAGSSSDTAALVFSSDENRGMTLRSIPDVGVFNVMARFTESPSEPIRLKVGESLTLSFTLSATSPRSAYRAIAIGLLNSHGTELKEPFYMTETSAPFGGYIVRTDLGSGDSDFGTVLSKRIPSAEQFSLYHSDTLREDVFSERFHARPLNLEDGVSFEGVLTITRTGERSNEVRFSLNGAELLATDTAAEDFAFDSVNFGFSPEAADAISLNNIKIVLTTASPSVQK